MPPEDDNYDYYNFSSEKIEYVTMGGAALSEAEYVVIGFHGRGGNDDRMFENLEATFVDSPNVTYLAPASADGEWFDEWIVPPTNENLLSALAGIDALIASLAADGIDSSQIVLAGHSQGSTLVAEYVARGHTGFQNVVLMSAPYNGVNLPVGQQKQIYSDDLSDQPIRLTVHEFDPKFDINTMEQTRSFFEDRGADADLSIHPGRLHLMTEDDYDVLRSTVSPIEGTSAGESITGGAASELIYAFAGNDTVLGGDGNDTVMGGRGNDNIDVQEGDDTVYAGNGNDYVELGSGNDRAFLGSGNDTVFAGDGDDLVMLGRGHDEAHLGAGDDYLRVNVPDVERSRNVAYGEDGFDTLQIVLDAKQGSAKVVIRELRALQEFLATAEPEEEYSSRKIKATISGFEQLDIVGPIVAEADAVSTTENAPAIFDVLANDRDILGDTVNLVDSNDRLQIIGIDARRLTAGASLTVSDDGRTLEFEPGTAFDWLAADRNYVLKTNYTVADDQTNRVEVGFTLTVHGENDAPQIVPTSDSAVSLSASDAPLAAEGTLLVSDVDKPDVVTASLVGVVASGSDIEFNLTEEELRSFFELSPTTPVPGNKQEGPLAWSFDSTADAFDFLGADGESTIVYTIEVQDLAGEVATEIVSISVSGAEESPPGMADPPPGDPDAFANQALLDSTEPDSGDGFESLF